MIEHINNNVAYLDPNTNKIAKVINIDHKSGQVSYITVTDGVEHSSLWSEFIKQYSGVSQEVKS